MKNEPSLNPIEMLTWEEARSRVLEVNPELGKVLDAADLTAKESFVLAHYPYGKDFYTPDNFFLPSPHNGLTPIDGTETPKVLQQALSYSSLPLGIILSNKVEVFFQTTNRVITDKLWDAGTVFGAWEIMDDLLSQETARYSYLSSGARSLFMASKISDGIAHRRLTKHFHLKLPPPQRLIDHRDVFSEIANQNHDETPWHCSVLYLHKNTVKKLFEKQKSMAQLYFYKEAWRQSFNCRYQFEHNIAWENLLSHIGRSNIYLQPRTCAHLKQLFMINEGIFPGMVFSDENDNTIAPIPLLKKAYKDIYVLNKAPVFIRPEHITPNKPVYYSLNYPQYFDAHLPTKTQLSLMKELETIESTLKLLHEQHHVPFQERLFHMIPDSDSILPAKDLVKNDKILSSIIKNGNEFPENSPFFKGCIQIIKQSKIKDPI